MVLRASHTELQRVRDQIQIFCHVSAFLESIRELSSLLTVLAGLAARSPATEAHSTLLNTISQHTLLQFHRADSFQSHKVFQGFVHLLLSNGVSHIHGALSLSGTRQPRGNTAAKLLLLEAFDHFKQ